MVGLNDVRAYDIVRVKDGVNSEIKFGKVRKTYTYGGSRDVFVSDLSGAGYTYHFHSNELERVVGKNYFKKGMYVQLRNGDFGQIKNKTISLLDKGEKEKKTIKLSICQRTLLVEDGKKNDLDIMYILYRPINVESDDSPSSRRNILYNRNSPVSDYDSEEIKRLVKMIEETTIVKGVDVNIV